MQTPIEKKYNKLIIALSAIIPLAVALLFTINLKKLGFNKYYEHIAFIKNKL